MYRWLEQIAAVSKQAGLLDEDNLDEMVHPINLTGVLYSKLKGSPSLNPKILHELAKLVVGAESLFKTGEDYERLHLVVFALIYLVTIKDPMLAERVCCDEFLSVPMDVKYCAKAFGQLARKKSTLQCALGNDILLSPLNKTGLQCFQRSDFALEHVLQLKRAIVGAEGEVSRALLGLAMRVRMDMFVETEDQALLLLSLGQELGYSSDMLITLVRNDRNAKFRSFLLSRLLPSSASKTGSVTFQQCITRERFVEASKRIRTNQESALLDMYNTTLAPIYFDAAGGAYSQLAIRVNTSTEEEEQQQQQHAKLSQQQPTVALPQLMLPKQVTTRERLPVAATAPMASSLTRTLAEKTKPKQLTAVFAGAADTTPKTTTAAQLRNKLKQKN